MPRQRGIIRIIGKVGDMSYYENNGQGFLRTASGPSKEQIQNGANYKRTRENNSEFGGSATVAKAIKDGFVTVISKIKDRYLHARLVEKVREINKRSSTGLRGQRPFSFVANKDLLAGFEFGGNITLDGVLLAPYTLAANAGRTAVTLTLADFNTDDLVNAPQGATHFRIINAIAVISNYSYVVSTKKYEAVDTTLNKKNASAYSSYIPIGGMVGSSTTLVATLPGTTTMNTNVGLIACVGIEFYQQVGTAFNLLSSDNALKVADIF